MVENPIASRVNTRCEQIRLNKVTRRIHMSYIKTDDLFNSHDDDGVRKITLGWLAECNLD